MRGVQGWASLIKKSTGEELFRGVAEGDLDKVGDSSERVGIICRKCSRILRTIQAQSQIHHIFCSQERKEEILLAVNRRDDDRSSDAGSTPPVTPRAADPQGSAGKGVLALAAALAGKRHEGFMEKLSHRQLLLPSAALLRSRKQSAHVLQGKRRSCNV